MQDTKSTLTATAQAVRPFTVNVPEEALADLRRRIAATRWPTKELVADRSHGVQLATMQELARYWTSDYDWRKCEARLNALPQFTTEIDGVEIHFIHVRSRHENALPLIMTHGWPGSVIELLDTVGPLTDPTAHGGTRRGRIPPGAAVLARLRLLGRAGRARLGRRPHRTRVGGADAPPRLHPLRRPGRRRGCPRHGPDGPPGGRGSGRLPPEPAHGGARDRRSTAQGIRTGTRSGRGGRDVQARRLRLLPRDGDAAADDRLRPARFTGRPGRLDARPRHGQLLQDLPRVRRRRARGQSHPGQHRRQHHAVLADGHRSLGGPVVLGGRTSAGASLASGQAPPPVTVPVGFTTFPGEIWASPRAAGSRRSTPASPTSTRSTGAATSPPGRSRSSSPPRCAPHSAHCANDAMAGRVNDQQPVRARKRRSS